LYDLEKDGGEENNVAEKHPGIVRQMLKIMNESRISSEVFPFVASVKNQNQ
jgi:hypothetical protein